ncbi:MAG: 30S ribosomal protein S15 [Candidatus Micrarchaeia archaeon]
MARLHSKKRGKSGSKKPSVKILPEWVEYSPQDITQLVIRLYKEGNSTAMVGQILRDQYGIPSVKSATGMSISQIIEKEGMKIEYPEDMLNLIKRAVRMRRHLKERTQDIHNKIKLVHVESKIRRLARYYTSTGRLPKDWHYDPEQAALLVK